MMPGTLSYKRDFPPAHYLLKVDSYTLLSSELGTEKYDTSVFEAGGHKWRLCFYPNGDIENNGKDHISLYLAIVQTETYNCDWEVNVIFKMFIYNQIEDKYLIIQDGGVKRFHEMKKQWGFARLISFETFKDSSNGYLFKDLCVFGVEIFVIFRTCIWESVALLRNPANGTFTWHILEFSKLDKYKPNYSEVFNVGGVNWKLMVYPKGDWRGKDNSFSFFLTLADWDKHPTNEAVFAKFILRVLSRVPAHNSVNPVMSRSFTYNKNGYSFGYSLCLALNYLHDASKGFIANDSLKVEVELFTVSTTEISSKRKRVEVKIDNF